MKKGFTLIELLVVLVIIGILVALILPNAINAIARAQDRECASNIRTINTAIQLCYSQTSNYQQCQTIAQLVATTPPSLTDTPVCPYAIGYVIPGAATPGTPTSVTVTGHFATTAMTGRHSGT